MGLRLQGAGKRYVYAAHHADLNLTEWTWTMYFRLDAAPGSGGDNRYVLVQKGDQAWTTSESFNYYVHYYESGGSHYIEAAFADTTGTKHQPTSVTTLDVDRWHSLAFAFNDTTKVLSLWLAKMESPTEAAETSYTELISQTYAGKTARTSNTRPLMIGAAYPDGGTPIQWLNADITISECALYDEALTPASALNGRLGQRLSGGESGLVAYWPLDDGAGRTGDTQTAYDRAGGEHGLTLVNRPSWADDPSDLYFSTGIHGRNACIGYYDALSHYDPLVPAAPTVTGNDDATGRDADFLMSPRSCAVTRTADVTGAKTWVLDLARATPVSLVVLSGHNWTSAATITIDLHTADSWGSPAVTESVLWAPDPIQHFLAKPYQYRYMRLSVTDAANSDGYLQLGVFRPFAIWEASQPGDMTDALSYSDLSATVETPHGDRTSRTRAKPRTYAMELSSLPTGEARELTRVLRAVGNGGYVWMCDDPQRHLRRHGIYGVLSADVTETLAEPSGSYRHIRRLVVTEDVP